MNRVIYEVEHGPTSLAQLEKEGKLRYREFSLEEAETLYAPRKVYDNGDQTYIIHPLPCEGRTVLQVPNTVPVTYASAMPISPTVALPTHNYVLAEKLHADNAARRMYVRFGRLHEIQEKGQPHHTDTPRFRLNVGAIEDADAYQIIVHNRVTDGEAPRQCGSLLSYERGETVLPAWRSSTYPTFFPSQDEVDFYRYIVNELEYIDYHLVRYDPKHDWAKDGWIKELYEQFLADREDYIISCL